MIKWKGLSINKYIVYNNIKILGVEFYSGNILCFFWRVGDVYCFIKRVFFILYYYNNNG